MRQSADSRAELEKERRDLCYVLVRWVLCVLGG